MKTLNKALHILAIVGSAAAIVFLFFSFLEVTTSTTAQSVPGSLLLFGSKLSDGVKMAVSSKLVFVMLLNLITLIYSAVSFTKKYPSSRFIAAGFSLVNVIYTLVYICMSPKAFLDVRPLTNIISVSYGTGVYLMFAGICLAAVAGIAYLFLDDYLICKETGNATIMKKVVGFLKDYKSELGKIVWPGKSAVLKNTLIVLIMFLLVGAFIWLIDFGLGSLLSWIW